MPNDMRDRLIELIQDIKLCNPTNWDKPEFMALALLANGVILPPCNVGDTVYVIHDDKVRQAVILAFYIDKVGINCELKISMNGENPTAPCCVTIIDKDTYTDNDIYLTREDAKKALRERDGE